MTYKERLVKWIILMWGWPTVAADLSERLTEAECKELYEQI